MNKLTVFLAHKIIVTNAYRNGISTMTTLCFIGIFIGSFALAIVTAIMHGFEKAIEEKMQGIHSHITIDGYGQTINNKALKLVLNNEFPEISSFSPHAQRYALFHVATNNNDLPAVVMLNAINPATECLTSTLAEKIINPLQTPTFDDLFTDNKIVIGKQLAHHNNLVVGDTVELFFIREEKISHRKATFDSYTMTIGGIFNTGIDEFDNGVVYCSFSLLEKVFPHIAPEKIALKLKPYTDEQAFIKRLHNRIHLHVYSWKELYPSLIAAQKLEKYVSFSIIALILAVASMNIISLLYMHITQKRQDIAILKALGMSNSNISAIFFIIGMGISIFSSSLGLIAALIASYLIKNFSFITLPDTYYVTNIPIAMNWYIIGSVFIVVIMFSFCATWFAIQQIKSINISRVLRFEG